MPPFARPASPVSRGLLLRSASLLALLGGTAHAATAPVAGTSYTGPATGGTWSNSANWTNGAPTATSAATGGTVNTDGVNSTDTLTVGGTSGVAVGDQTSLTIGSAITNGGLITINAFYGSSLQTNGAVTLNGGGTVTLTSGASFIQGAGSLANVDNLIQGMGTIGRGQIVLDNRAGGVINANNGTLTVNPTTFSNEGTAKAGGGGNLDIRNTAVTQTGAGTILSTGAGSTVNLTNGSVSGGTLATTAGGTFTGSGTNTLTNVRISTGSTFTAADQSVTFLGGTITNNGTLTSNSFYGTEYRIAAGTTTTLTGGGTLLLGGNTSNLVRDPDAGTGTLVNVNNAITGSGQLGYGQLHIVNQTAGLVDAAAGDSLTVQANTAGVDNSGTLRASGGGTLTFTNTTINQVVSGQPTTGTILSTGAGSTVALASATVNGGTLTIANGGVMSATGTNRLANVTLSGGSTFTNNDQAFTYLDGTITNKGTLLGSSFYGSEFRISGGQTTTLQGGGTLTLNGTASLVRDADAGTGTLVNVDNAINGFGQLGVGGMGLNNQAGGTVNANATGNTLVLNTNGGTANAGTLSATNGGTLNIVNTVVTQTAAGLVLADGTGTVNGTTSASTVTLSSSTVNNGTLTSRNGGVLQTAGTNSLNNVRLSTGSVITANDQTTTYLGGTFANQGAVNVNAGYGSELRVGAGSTTTLTGGGTISLNGQAAYIRDADAATGTLVNVDNTIQGIGQVGNGQLGIDNRAGGTINANNGGGTLYLQGNSPNGTNTNLTGVSNAGLIEATGGGNLQVSGTVSQTGIGSILTANASTTTLANATVNNGMLTTTGTGVLQTAGTNSLNNVNLTSGSTLVARDQTTTYLGGTVNNQGTINLNSFYGSELRIGAGATTTLTGGGTVALNGGNALLRDADAATGRLVNTDNVITGSGQLGYGQLAITNGPAGTLLANGATLTINTNAAGLTNNGTIQATAGGTATVTGGPLTNYAGGTLTGGTYRADASSTVNLNTAGIATNAATIILSGTGSALNTQAGSIESTLTSNTGSLQVLAGRGYATANDLANSGAIQLGGGTLAPNSLTNSGTLTGFGTTAPTNGSPLGNSGTVTAAGGTLNLATGIAGTGTLAASTGATASLAAGPAANTVGTLALNGGTLTLGTNAVTVGNDYTNTAFGTGNGFNKRADVTGTGAINASGNTAQAITGAKVVNGATATPTIALGDFHTTDANHTTSGATTTYQVANTGTAGAALRGAIQTTGVTDTRLSGSGVTAQSFGPVATGSSSGPYTVSVAGSGAGQLSGQSIHVANNFTNVAEQTVAVTGTGYNYAQSAVNGSTAATGTTVNLGNFRVGSTQSAALTIGNVAPTGAFTEKLDAAAGTTTGNAVLGGGITGLAAGGTSTAVSVGLNTASAGAKSGTATVNFTSNAAGVDSLGNSALPSQVVSVNGNAFRLATGSAGTPVSVGNVHVGDTASTALAVTNTAANDGFSEKLNAAVSVTSGAVSGTSGSVSLLAAGGTSNAITASLNTATAGAKSGTVALNYASDGTGTTGATASANGNGSVTVSGNVYNLASSSSIGNVNFGVLHTGSGTQSQAVSVTNTAAAGNFSEGLNTSFGAYTNNGGTIGVSSGGSVVNLAAGSTNSSSLKLSVSTAVAGQISGSIAIHQSSNGTISGLSDTTLADQNPGVSGTVQATVTNLAQAQINTAQPVAFGNVRIGTTQQQALSITNAAPASQFSESLIAGVAGTSGGVVASGGFGRPTSVPSLVAQGTDTTHVVVGIDTSSAGSKSGNATLNFKSDGTAYNGGTVTDLGNTDVAVTVNVYRLASPAVNTPSVALAARVGGMASTAISVTNTSPDSFTEGLKASAATASPGFSSSGGIANLVAGGTDATSLKVGLNTGTSGAFSGTQTLTFASTGAGTTGAADMALASGSVAVSGKVYAAAVASETPNPVSFGTVHVGDTATKALTVGNTATGALTDVLTGGFGTVSSKFSGTGTLGGGVAAGGTSNALTVGLDTLAAGSFSGSAALAFSSHDGDLADIGVSAGPVSLSGTVNNYAVSGFGKLGGAGTFSGGVTGYTLNFGTVTQGSAGLMDMLYAGNFAAGLADLLAGSFADQGSAAFSLNGFAPFSGLGAGQNTGPFSVSFGTSALGMFSDVVTLFGIGSNDSGYSGAVPNITLTLLGDVVAGSGGGGGTAVPEPGSLAVLGAALAGLAALRRRRA